MINKLSKAETLDSSSLAKLRLETQLGVCRNNNATLCSLCFVTTHLQLVKDVGGLGTSNLFRNKLDISNFNSTNGTKKNDLPHFENRTILV